VVPGEQGAERLAEVVGHLAEAHAADVAKVDDLAVGGTEPRERLAQRGDLGRLGRLARRGRLAREALEDLGLPDRLGVPAPAPGLVAQRFIAIRNSQLSKRPPSTYSPSFAASVQNTDCAISSARSGLAPCDRSSP
jgi:hypothetical protein